MNIDPLIIGQIVEDRETKQAGRIVDIQHTKKTGLNVAVFFPGAQIYDGKSGWELEPEDTTRSIWYVESRGWGGDKNGRSLASLQIQSLKEYREVKQNLPEGSDLSIRDRRRVVRALYPPEKVEVPIDQTPID